MFHSNLTITDNMFVIATLIVAGLVFTVVLVSWAIDNLMD